MCLVSLLWQISSKVVFCKDNIQVWFLKKLTKSRLYKRQFWQIWSKIVFCKDNFLVWFKKKITKSRLYKRQLWQIWSKVVFCKDTFKSDFKKIWSKVVFKKDDFWSNLIKNVFCKDTFKSDFKKTWSKVVFTILPGSNNFLYLFLYPKPAITHVCSWFSWHFGLRRVQVVKNIRDSITVDEYEDIDL